MNEEPAVLESSDGIKIPEVILEEKILYHGSRSDSIDSFNTAEESTVGAGLYLTSDLDSARNYAVVRSRGNETAAPTIYKVEVKNLKLADLRNKQGVKQFSAVMLNRLLEMKKDSTLNWLQREIIQGTIDKIVKNDYISLNYLVRGHQNTVTNLLRERGFDGLIALEGGEGEETKVHDSYVVFDPEKVDIQSKEKVN